MACYAVGSPALLSKSRRPYATFDCWTRTTRYIMNQNRLRVELRDWPTWNDGAGTIDACVVFQSDVEVLCRAPFLALLVALAVYAVGRFRGGAEEERLGASELMSKFREVHARGWAKRRGIPNYKDTVGGQVTARVKE